MSESDTNILKAVIAYSELSNKDMEDIYASSNRINRVGDKLEYFAMDLFCDSIEIQGKEGKEKKYSNYFSWSGTKNHPPDFMISQGDAFEVKKLTSESGSIQLNSSTPHQKIKKDNERITKECRECEDSYGGWEEKDLVYIIGRIPRGEKSIDFIWMIYGDCWAAPGDVYKKLSDRLSNKVKKTVNSLEYGKLSKKTNEIGKVYNADPLGRTKLRIRGMWIMKHPANYFREHIKDYESKISDKKPLFAVMKKEKFQEFPKTDKKTIKSNDAIKIKEIDIPDPANPANRIDAILIETGV